MIEKIKLLSKILNESYNEKTVVTCLGDFFAHEFNSSGFNIILKTDYTSDKPFFPLYKHNGIIGYVEFDCVNSDLNEFLETALPLISLKVQNIVLTARMQKSLEFQNVMKNIAKIIETQYELQYIIPLLGEMIDKFIQDHLIYIFVKKDDKFLLMWPNSCKDTKIFDIINAEPLKRVTTEELGVFPLVYEEKLLGYIVTKNLDNKLTYKEIEYMEELTSQSATTINRANSYAEILKHATLDALTGFYNRGQLEERVKQEISSSKRQKTPLCVIMTDIDYFKKVNDKYGHLAGDLVLKTVSKIMRSQLREYDTAGRYGGEEFVILLPFTKLREAKMVAERLRKKVEQANIEISDTETISITISMGIYEINPDDNEETLIKNVDKALYEAKETGRNRIVAYEV